VGTVEECIRRFLTPILLSCIPPMIPVPICLIEERMMLLTDDTRFFWIVTMRIKGVEEILMEVVD